MRAERPEKPVDRTLPVTKRATDRVETAVLALLVAAFLIGGRLQVWTDRNGDLTAGTIVTP